MIKQISDQERGIFATEQQQKIVMECDPLVICLLLESRHQHCNYCLKSTQVQKCSICKHYYYCSQECQKLDWKLHKAECSVIKLINHNIPSNLLILFRIHLNQIDISNFYGDVNNINENNVKQFQECATIVVNYTDKNLDAISRLMLLQIKIQLNIFTINTNLGQSIAIGLYTPANFFNHRCDTNNSTIKENVSNSYPIYRGRKLMILLNDQYQLNSELTISYTDIPEYSKRQQYLFENYGFICQCYMCQSKSSRNNIYTQLTEKYLELLEIQSFQEAFKVLEQLLICMPKQFNDSKHPYIGWRMAEAAKLAFHCDYLRLAEDYSIQALKILQPIYDETEEYKEIQLRLQEIKHEIRYGK